MLSDLYFVRTKVSHRSGIFGKIVLIACTVCGILGLLLRDPSIDAAPEICEGLSLLQHRGQDACGIVTCGAKGRFYQCKANGMVRDVFDASAVSRLHGGMGVGHGMCYH